MSIEFDQKLQAWTTKNLTDEEKEVLIEMATNMITDQLGAELAENIVKIFQSTQMLKGIPKEEMGTA